jgi:uncharacterized protein YndB with AHSA1/START domain
MFDEMAKLAGAVTREVRDATRDGQAVRIVVAARDYDTNLDDLWNAITTAERLKRWFAPVSGEFKLGGRYAIEGNASGTITRCEPPRELELTWEFGPGVSWVEVSLTPIGESARLELRHIAPVDPHWEKFGPGAAGVGWDLGLMGLARHIENPAAERPPEADTTWMSSTEAKHFIGLCAADWGRADIASGADAAQAHAAAEATRKFYSGEA